MNIHHVLLLVLHALGLAIGQLLFKAAANEISSMPPRGLVLQLLSSRYFFCAFLLYVGMSFFWTWILTKVPISRAYPFVVLAFVFVPLLARIVFGEPLSIWYVAAILLILSGLAILLIKG